MSSPQRLLCFALILGLSSVGCGGSDAGSATGTAPDKGLPTRSAGCDTTAAPSPVEGTVVNLDGRSYRYYLPQGYDSSRAYPVVYVLHGTGANGQQMSQYIKMQDYVQGRAIVVFPDGAGGRWDTSGDSDLQFFDAMNADLGAKSCMDPSRVFVTGFSLGGYMTNYLGCHRGAAIRAIAPAAGGFPGAAEGCTPLPAFVYHKRQDDVVAITQGEAARDAWKSIDGCSDDTQPFGELGCVSYKGCAEGTALVWCADEKQTPYPHDFDADYRTPMWEWFASLP